jgi:hypothetical protein
MAAEVGPAPRYDHDPQRRHNDYTGSAKQCPRDHEAKISPKRAAARHPAAGSVAHLICPPAGIAEGRATWPRMSGLAHAMRVGEG